jgi:thiol:disulfide interchange protein DsbD
MKKILHIIIIFALALAASGQIEGPFSAEPMLETDGAGARLTVTYRVTNDKAYLYRSMMGVDLPEGIVLSEISVPGSKKKYDQFQDADVDVYTHDVNFVYGLSGPLTYPLEVTVRFQGCDESLCFMPVAKTFSLTPGEVPSTSAGSADGVDAPAVEAVDSGFSVAAKASGYLDKDKFLAFIDSADGSETVSSGRLRSVMDRHGMAAMVLLVIIFGLSLNLTPCVLPMIPVNIAIIGAGAQAGSRGRGFLLGGTYGFGIALVYGFLGLLFVKAGTRFGQLNASPVFNIAIGLVFLLLSLAMFGVFNLDLTRYQARLGTGGRKGSFITAFILGAIAALLAGACVAPVVISTLVLALDVYNKENAAGLLLPFLLGLGMALPWPFAGAGLSFLPKAGIWMEKVKYGFGVVIMVAALYYGGLGIKLAIDTSASSQAEVRAAAESHEGWHTDLGEAMKAAAEDGKPLFIDFWASWCKNCLKMEKTTFKEQEVISRLDAFVKVKFDATHQGAPEVKAVLDRYVEVGLPTYVILKRDE